MGRIMSGNRPPNLPPWAGDETEPFRVFRLTNFEAQSATDGELLGALHRSTVEMLCRDQSGAVVALLRHQADLAEAMLPPRAERPPAPDWHSWRRYASYSPTPDEEGRPSPAEAEKADQPAKDITPTVDKALETAIRTGQTIADVEADPDDAPPGVPVDHTWERQKIQDAIEEAAEAEAEHKREAAQFEADLVARAAEGWRE